MVFSIIMRTAKCRCGFLVIAFIIGGQLLASMAYGQTSRYQAQINEFKRLDSIEFPPDRSILFIGSSSFTRWKDVGDYFPGYSIINRGFGGSVLPDQVTYLEDIVFPYQPKQIVIYCGENDLNRTEIGPDEVFFRFQQLYQQIRERWSKVHITYVSMKPSPRRARLMPDMLVANGKISDLLAQDIHGDFVDVYHRMLDPYGAPMQEIFTSDSLHMNEKGYMIWQESIKPFLLK